MSTERSDFARATVTSVLSAVTNRLSPVRPIVFSRPLRLVEPTSWVSHIPFAFWLVDALRPRTIVELGTQSGNSFAAMAQGLQMLGLDSVCYAIDTWKGDPHTGFYADEVYQEWRRFHDQHFGAFSCLVRSTFDEALSKFADGSVDLLHIDGFHTYEAVHHDFESWLPKLSSKGVVLLHDINERDRDFGVWRFWQELSRQYPCFTFLHGHGLGVVGVGADLSGDVRVLVEDVPRNGSDTFILRQFFGTLGEALLATPREDAHVRREADLNTELMTSAIERERLTAALADRDAQLGQARAVLDRRDAELAQTRAVLDERDAELAQTRAVLVQRDAELTQTRAVLDRRDAELGSARDDARDAKLEIARMSALAAEGDERIRAIERQAADQAQREAQLASGRESEFQGLRRELEELEERHRAEIRARDQECVDWCTLLVRLKASRSWRMSAPFRTIGALAREGARHARPGRRSPSMTSVLRLLRPSMIRQMRLIRRCGVFDEAFYLRQVTRHPELQADLVSAWTQPLAHYLVAGASHGLDPHPLFDSSFYLERNPDVAQADVNPLWHYLSSGGAEGRDPHPLFHSAMYLGLNRDVLDSRINPLVHFLRHGAGEGRNPNAWFDISHYLESDPALRSSGENALLHFLRVGASEGRPAGPSFDTAYYSRANPDVLRAGMNPLTHYVLAGQAEGRRASPLPTIREASDVASRGAGDIASSIEAYQAVRTRAQEIEAARIKDLVPVAPPMIRISEKEDLYTRARDVVLRAEASPEASIIIPIVNGARMTLECLLSITRFTNDVAFEVVLVDNGSTDGSFELFSAIPNVRVVRHDENAGFGRGCNAGADVARGKYLVFLNNDAQVQPGWLPALLLPFADSDAVGAVGPKVLFPDGRLQDAGSLVNPDGTSTLIGVFDDPALPRFGVSREVDYVSGVCLAVEARRFREEGGFDAEFEPAYCEDVDLCLRLRSDGLRVVYQPAATIVHHLSVTSAALGSSFKLNTITRNQQRLSIRHQAQIDDLDSTRIIAFYLPQFHPIPENDVWWGKGFTEWRNVTRARPNFEGHYQPRLSADLGFYDLRLEETYVEQTALARRYGVHGFCFYYYWFDGKRLLERPIERLLQSGALDFPFCLCWANENWTRRWDGLDHEILIAQSHSDKDEAAVIDDLIRYLSHPAYIRIHNRPLVLIYNATRFPDIQGTFQRWRARCRERGIGEIYLAFVESFELSRKESPPANWGFDASVEFPPHHGGLHPVEPARLLNPNFTGRVFDYNKTALHYMTRPLPGYPRFRTVIPGWDNTARRQDDAVVFAGSTPGAYQAWLEWTLRQTREQNFGDERLVFVNAWNEWAEGAYLEPDLGWGHAYLEATRDAQDNLRLGLYSR